jgi:thiosulfate reductase / polysulfide reductase chain A
MKLDRRDFLKIGAVAGAAIAAPTLVHLVTRKKYAGREAWQGKHVGKIEQIPSMCQACTSACGIIANVKDGRLLTVHGNPADPNSMGAICAKGAAAASILYDPYRVLYPLKRVGKRGEGKWKRISWEEAYTEIADRLKKIRESGHPEELAFQQGRNRSADAVARFLDAFGTPTQFNHRALCSANRRAAILSTIGDTDWDLGDYENTRYLLNFGCNWAEAHQGGLGIATRIMKARERGAKIVTFETRLSNTAAVSDEWFCVKPGTDGLIALAMANVICSENLWDKQWFDTWCNVSADTYAEHVAQYTPERAAAESGVPADDIRRIAREFAAAAPRGLTSCGRGSHAHRNGYYNDRAITVLNALVGNMGHEGGWTWHPKSGYDKKQHPEPEPVPPKPTAKSVIAQAKNWPLANAYEGYGMKVGTIVYQWIKEKKQKLSAMITYNTDQAWSWPEMGGVQEVLRDEELIPFHVVIDVMYSETAHLADIILPWTTYLERWDIDARPPGNLIDYVGLRQPVVKPLGESKDIRDIFPELARRIGGGMEKYYPWKSTEEYLAAHYKNVPGGLEYMKKNGAWLDPTKKKNYVPYLKQLTDKDLEGSATDPVTGIITKGEDEKTKKPIAIGIMINGVPRVGFKTPSRKVEVFSKFLVDKSAEVGLEVSGLPIYEPIPDHARGLADDQLIMTSFKWNVHNAHRTMQSMWLQEIVHSNPAWINPQTAAKLGLADGDWVEVTSYRPNDPKVPHGDGSVCGTLRTQVRVTAGVHPKTLAMSHNAGRTTGGPIATQAEAPKDFPGFAETTARPGGIWWHGTLSTPQNNLMPVHPDPITGQQAYHDTVVKIRKV